MIRWYYCETCGWQPDEPGQTDLTLCPDCEEDLRYLRMNEGQFNSFKGRLTPLGGVRQFVCSLGLRRSLYASDAFLAAVRQAHDEGCYWDAPPAELPLDHAPPICECSRADAVQDAGGEVFVARDSVFRWTAACLDGDEVMLWCHDEHGTAVHHRLSKQEAEELRQILGGMLVDKPKKRLRAKK